MRALVDATRCDIVHPRFDALEDPFSHLTRERVAGQSATGTLLLALCVKTPAAARRVISLGVDGACTTDPRTLTVALERYR